MNFIKFCPQCKSDKLIIYDNKFKCDNCDFEYYHNTATATALILKFNDSILFSNRNIEPEKGKLELPGGFVDYFETAEEGMIREIKEELGIEIKAKYLKYLGSQPNKYFYKNVIYHTLDLFYEYHLNEKVNFKVDNSEISKIEWIKLFELNLSLLAFDSQKKFITKLLLTQNYQ